MAFSYEDFLLFTKAPNTDAKMFSILAPAVLKVIETIYKIKVENTTSYQFTQFIETTEFTPLVTPINSITSITYDGEPVDYTYYGDVITVTSTIPDFGIPLVITVDAGWVTVPDDLKYAIYSHIEHLYFSTMNSTDSVQKVINSTGNTTYFRDSEIPKASRIIYDMYSVRQLIL